MRVAECHIGIGAIIGKNSVNELVARVRELTEKVQTTVQV